MPELAALLSDWVAGWCVSRGTPPPTRDGDGFTIDVGLADQRTRHVLTRPTDDVLRRFAGTVDTPATWLKFPRPRAEVVGLFDDGWVVHDQEHLMRHDLRPLARPVPAGYRVAVHEEPGVIQVFVHPTADSQVAAKGRIGLIDAGVVVDQVLTSPDHQRRGLGTLVMSVLAEVAIDHDRRSAVLLASEEGRALYSTLGWTLVSPFTATTYVGTAGFEPATPRL